MLFLNNIDLGQNELLNGVIHKSTSSTRPADPVLGQLTYDTSEFTIYSWDGTQWIPIKDTDAVLSIVGTSPINASEDVNRQVTISVDNATADGLGVIQLAGDLTGGTAESPVVSGVGGGTSDATSAAEIHSAYLASHAQNTDTGTTSGSFQIDSGNSGPKIKNVNGEVQLRNSTDDNWANLKVKDLHVEGTISYLHSTDVYIGDSFITLNDQVMVSSNNTNGGFDVKRLKADVSGGADTISGVGVVITGTGTTFLTDVKVGDVLVFGAQRRTITKVTSDTVLEVSEAFNPQPTNAAFSYANQINPRIYFDDANNIWKLIDGTLTNQYTFPIVRKYSADVGNGTDKDITITHNLNTRDVTVSLRLTGSDYAGVMVDWKAATVDTVTLHFNKAPTAAQYRVTITG